MDIELHDQCILELDDTDPAKKFFLAFNACRDNSVGRHHDWTGEVPIEQAWTSADGKEWLYSNFAYTHLSKTLMLDGCIAKRLSWTDDENALGKEIPVMRTLLNECIQAARQDENLTILFLADEVLAMLDLAEDYLRYREDCFTKICFAVDSITVVNDKQCLIPGLVHAGNVRLGSYFDACKDQPEIKNLYCVVEKIVAYRHSLDELSQGVTGLLTVSGNLAEFIPKIKLRAEFVGRSV